MKFKWRKTRNELLKHPVDTGLGVIKKLKYEGAKTLKIWKTINKILNSILYFTVCQCKSTDKEVMWKYLLSLHINLTGTHVLHTM